MTQTVRAALIVALAVGTAQPALAGQVTPGPTTQTQQAPVNQPAQVPIGEPAPVAQPGAQTPTTSAPGTPQGVAPTPVTPLAPVCPAPVPPATLPARSFTSKAGLLLHQVQPTRVVDFENFLQHVRQALANTTNPTLREQARGWKFHRVLEPGPNGDVLYAFVLDPAVPCVDYALGPIIADAYPDPAQAMEVWKLYTGSVRNGGTLMNLVALPLMPPAPVLSPRTTPATTPETPPVLTPDPPPSTTPSSPAPSAPGQRPQVPLDGDPVNRP